MVIIPMFLSCKVIFVYYICLAAPLQYSSYDRLVFKLEMLQHLEWWICQSVNLFLSLCSRIYRSLGLVVTLVRPLAEPGTTTCNVVQ